METISNYYDDTYYSWQKDIGEFGGWANKSKFEKYITPDSDVLDFGCGGGFLLKELNCRKKVGVEVNPAAQKKARENQIEVYTKTDEIPDEYVDIIISNNALEHTLLPLQELKLLYKKLKKGGAIIFVVPCESINYAYKPDNINHHLYSWSPMCIGNLFGEAGFKIIESKSYIHKWPPYHRAIARLGGRPLFEILCRIYGRIERSWFQVIVRGIKQERF